jgi:hypothetical protein
MVLMKGYLRNRTHPEGSMIEATQPRRSLSAMQITSKMENQ